MKINNKSNFSIIEQIGEGAFGIVYKCIEKTNNTIYCIKIEKNNLNLLSKEGILYQFLDKKKSLIPKFYYCGNISLNEKTVFSLVTEYYNTDISNYFNLFKNNLYKVLSLGYQMISVIESIHKQNVLHRDIKPENILILNADKDDFIVKLTDLGLCKNFIDNDGYHIQFRKNISPIGSLRFCSINSNKGYELSRRDDIYSLIYLLLYLYDGKVEWQNKNNDEIIKLKEQINIDKKHSLFFIVKAILKHIDTLDFEEKPNYKYLKSMLQP